MSSPLSLLHILISYLLSLFFPLKHVEYELGDDEQEEKDGLLADSQQFALERYFDSTTGAFPAAPLDKLPPAFHEYEQALRDAVDARLSLGEDLSEDAVSRRPAGVRWRKQVLKIKPVDFNIIRNDERALQRAHHVLAYLVAFYAHSTPPTSNGEYVIPMVLSRPLVAVSHWLGIAPVLTYADTVLWNWSYNDPNLPFSSANMVFQTLFNTYTNEDRDETEFYRCCAWIELRGLDSTTIIAEILQALAKEECAHNAAEKSAIDQDLARLFTNLEAAVQDFTHILVSVKQTCRPQAFFSSIRPWYRGADPSDNRKWIYEGVKDSELLLLSGPSAGQTTALHVLDALLGVEHGEDSQEFMSKMLDYMPREQRRLISDVKNRTTQLRSIVARSPAVKKAFGGVVRVVTEFRSEHVRVAVRYVVSPKNDGKIVCPFSGTASAPGMSCPASAAAPRKSRGTGGNELAKLLRASRDATKKAGLWAFEEEVASRPGLSKPVLAA